MNEEKLAQQVASAARSVEALSNQVTGYMQRTEIMLGATERIQCPTR